MEIRQISHDYAVSPQIAPEDAARIREAGFTTVICNRPDGENPPEKQAAAIRAAVEAAGMTFVDNPVVGGALTMENVEAQGKALRQSEGPVLAYCASGNRSSIVWALDKAGELPTDDIVAAPARYGYNMEIWRDQIEALAARKG
ncbi:TIGR01244 family sulfur transferase [Acidimangrovimonas pyrenivorans]|uniref:TIGR01244 family sulfur transferase n=1 Tax=Acidimangrovimonas pyrenivorans TaxID=2030798 RepID=A0ABV7AIF8_9RHOB